MLRHANIFKSTRNTIMNLYQFKTHTITITQHKTHSTADDVILLIPYKYTPQLLSTTITYPVWLCSEYRKWFMFIIFMCHCVLNKKPYKWVPSNSVLMIITVDGDDLGFLCIRVVSNDLKIQFSLCVMMIVVIFSTLNNKQLLFWYYSKECWCWLAIFKYYLYLYIVTTNSYHHNHHQQLHDKISPLYREK